MADLRGLKLQGGTYYAYVVVPRDVHHAFHKKSIWRTTQTGDPRQASKIGAKLREEMKREIALARTRCGDAGYRTTEARIALAEWAVSEVARPIPDGDSLNADWLTVSRADAFQKAADEPEGYKAIEGFDQFLARLLTAHGCVTSSDDELLPKMRQEAALTFLYAVKFGERARRANAFMLHARQVASSELDAVEIVSPRSDMPLPAPSLTISRMFEAWLAVVRPTEKQRQRYEHQLRRLIEFAGDRPANHLKRKDVTEFMSLVARFPGRKRSASLAELPMAKLVEVFGAKNVELIAKGATPLPTLSEKTVGDWFDAFRRCWSYGVAMELIESNPWDGLRQFVVVGADSIERRAFTDEEIKFIFTRPLFVGHSENCDGYRNERGGKVIKDAKYWLPLLSLFHGQRLTEFAAMQLKDVRMTDEGTWYFDLTKRKIGRAARDGAGVKSETSQRYIPFHPQIVKLGFDTYVSEAIGRGESWLFPDLDHESRFGPGHKISKWWGRWMDKIGLTDPTIVHHSFRHTWKRHARAAKDVKEEMHDVLSGHKGLNSVSRRYGEGAPVEALARDMAMIQIPAFPHGC